MIGIGHDIHRLVADRALVLGGVHVPSDVGFDTPSDGDVLCHALIDALAGALSSGDIGDHFPDDDDPEAQGARSVEYVRRMAEEIAGRGLSVSHVDAFITLGTVKLRPHLQQMREQLAGALLVEVERISVKARSNDGLGLEGEGAAASATAVVLLREP